MVATPERAEKTRVTAVSIVASLLLTCAKLAVGFLTGSLGLLAEAAHSALDLVASVITFFSVRIAGRPADEDHPYGHGRAENLSAIVRCAEERDNFVRIDMEDSSTTTETLEIYRRLRREGLDNVGVVLQAYMKRTLADIADLADLRPSVRVCKGIYIEPPEIAYQDFDTVRLNFAEAIAALLDVGGYVAVASHDEWVVAEALRIFAERGLAPEQYEFQMLLGVRPDLGDELVREGHRLRIYVPFGRQWYEYSLRRLQENPKIAGYIAADPFKRLRPGRNNRP